MTECFICKSEFELTSDLKICLKCKEEKKLTFDELIEAWLGPTGSPKRNLKKEIEFENIHKSKPKVEGEIVVNGFPSLEKIVLSSCFKPKIKSIINCPNLKKITLRLQTTKDFDIDFSQFLELRKLTIISKYETIKKIDLSKNNKLESLNLDASKIEEIILPEDCSSIKEISLPQNYCPNLFASCLEEREKNKELKKTIEKINKKIEDLKKERLTNIQKKATVEAEVKILNLQIHKEKQRKAELETKLTQADNLSTELLKEREEAEQEIQELQQKLVKKESLLTQLNNRLQEKEAKVEELEKKVKHYQELNKSNKQPFLQENQKLKDQIIKLKKQQEKSEANKNKITNQEVISEIKGIEWVKKHGKNIFFGFLIFAGLAFAFALIKEAGK